MAQKKQMIMKKLEGKKEETKLNKKRNERKCRKTQKLKRRG